MPLSKQTKLEHPHKNLIVEMGSSERESRAHWQYRRCPKHAVKNIDKKEDDHHIRELSCGCCHKGEPIALSGAETNSRSPCEKCKGLLLSSL